MLKGFLVTRKQYQDIENDFMAPYAVHSSDDPGRKYPEPEHEFRNCFQRDRDRILHSASFRRLEAKTQVFGDTRHDYFRTRLTHSFEVSQIARTMARALGVNEDLTEAAALAHDLGHPPYGHCGEEILDELMQDHGGFEHNSQSLRVVDYLEHPYPNFRGLNLCFETRDCLAKHQTRYDSPKTNSEFGTNKGSIEAQLADLADSIAYDSHDLDDSLAASLINESDLDQIDIYNEVRSIVQERYPDAHKIARQLRCAKTIIDIMVKDALNQTVANLEKIQPESVSDIKNAKINTVALSQSRAEKMGQLERFLYEKVYKHPEIEKTRLSAREEISFLFKMYTQNAQLMPQRFQNRKEQLPVERIACDYISGMTDRYCKEQYRILKQD